MRALARLVTVLKIKTNGPCFRCLYYRIPRTSSAGTSFCFSYSCTFLTRFLFLFWIRRERNDGSFAKADRSAVAVATVRELQQPGAKENRSIDNRSSSNSPKVTKPGQVKTRMTSETSCDRHTPRHRALLPPVEVSHRLSYPSPTWTPSFVPNSKTAVEFHYFLIFRIYLPPPFRVLSDSFRDRYIMFLERKKNNRTFRKPGVR